tara:strand:+ start:584 stop:844 length:261 start_codon:yes stop_codon:yes gene_type:complete
MKKILSDYYKMLIYSFLEFIGSFLNLFCSFFHVYPSLDLGVAWLIRRESNRIKLENNKRIVTREEKEHEAQSIEAKAKEGVDGADV